MEKFQQQVFHNHPQDKQDMIGGGNQKDGSIPFNELPSYERTKSAPPLGEAETIGMKKPDIKKKYTPLRVYQVSLSCVFSKEREKSEIFTAIRSIPYVTIVYPVPKSSTETDIYFYGRINVRFVHVAKNAPTVAQAVYKMVKSIQSVQGVVAANYIQSTLQNRSLGTRKKRRRNKLIQELGD